MTTSISAMAGQPLPPVIGKMPHHEHRLLVSVVVPTYQPDGFLVDALRSVLRQDLGPSQMQILVYDDASPTVDVAQWVKSAAADDRVEIHRGARNLGLAGNWNRALELCTGKYVHILHQDDRVLDGFYSRLLNALEGNSNVGMAFCRHSYIDEADRVTYRTRRERLTAGTLRKWLPVITERQRIQCASAIVRREVYERVGGFHPHLKFALDWEMWIRIAAQFDVWFEPKLLSAYRQHGSNETQRLKKQGEIESDLLTTIETFKHYLPVESRDLLSARAYATFARRALKRLDREKGLSKEQASQLLAHIGTAIDNMNALPKRAAGFRKLRESFERARSPS